MVRSHYVNQKLGGRNTVYVKGQYWDWNAVYKTYNSRKTNNLLTWADVGVRVAPKGK